MKITCAILVLPWLNKVLVVAFDIAQVKTVISLHETVALVSYVWEAFANSAVHLTSFFIILPTTVILSSNL